MQDNKEFTKRAPQQCYVKEITSQSQMSANNNRVLKLLESGEYTTLEIGEILQLPDPRSNIRCLRAAGYAISDYWTKIKNTRCKKYFLKHLK